MVVSQSTAQQEGRVYKIGYLTMGTPSFDYPPIGEWTGAPGAFRDALRDKGFIVEKNLVLDRRHGSGDHTKLSVAATSLVAAGADAIVTAGTPATKAAKEATNSVPIIFIGAALPVERGLVQSLARPGGNVTGVAVDVAANKTFQLVRDVSPTVQWAVFLNYRPNMLEGERFAAATARAREFAATNGYGLTQVSVDRFEEIEPALAMKPTDGLGALIISSDGTLYNWRTSILEIASRYRLLTICIDLSWSPAGCSVAYGDDPRNRGQRAATMLVKILRGAKPADIPVEQPATYKLIINSKTTRKLGIEVPPHILALADDVIE
jgi:putative ABC transport system substrate-binding protein